MMKVVRVLGAAVLCAGLAVPAASSPIEREAVTHLGMRWLCQTCDPRPLSFMAINWGDPEHNQGFEDRTFLVYDLSAFEDTNVIQSATLSIGLLNFDDGGPIGIIDVATTWLSEPDLPPGAFWWGEFLLDFEANEDSHVYEVDVTDWVRDGAGQPKTPFAFFSLSTDTFDRYFLGPAASLPVPTLLVTIPEPSSVCLLLCGTAIVVRPRRRGPCRY